MNACPCLLGMTDEAVSVPVPCVVDSDRSRARVASEAVSEPDPACVWTAFATALAERGVGSGQFARCGQRGQRARAREHGAGGGQLALGCRRRQWPRAADGRVGGGHLARGGRGSEVVGASLGQRRCGCGQDAARRRGREHAAAAGRCIGGGEHAAACGRREVVSARLGEGSGRGGQQPRGGGRRERLGRALAERRVDVVSVPLAGSVCVIWSRSTSEASAAEDAVVARLTIPCFESAAPAAVSTPLPPAWSGCGDDSATSSARNTPGRSNRGRTIPLSSVRRRPPVSSASGRGAGSRRSVRRRLRSSSGCVPEQGGIDSGEFARGRGRRELIGSGLGQGRVRRRRAPRWRRP